MTNPLVKCKAGSISGTFINNVNFFYGIPYAEPLTSNTQWNAPEHLRKEITLDATIKGFTAPQTIYRQSLFQDKSLPAESIDCLTLNIASKKLHARMPVMIWIHGGAYITGSANSSLYQLETLPLHDVVLVTINYRLGPFGFLKLDEVTDGKISSTGNEGLMDQRIAIEWVKSNIQDFGGDPDNISLFGESAGAWSVALQSAADPSCKLFSKAICQSGGMDAFIQKDRANQWGELFLKTLADNELLVEDLCKVPHDSIINIAKEMKHTMISGGQWLAPDIGFSPVADGKFLPLDPIKNFEGSDINLLIGTTADEYKLWSELEPYFLNLTNEQFTKRLSKIFNKQAISKIQSLYLDADLGEHSYKNALSSIMTDWTFGIHATELLEIHKSKTFGYQFNVKSPLLDGRLGAYHSSELPYLFGSWENNFLDWCSQDAKIIAEFLQTSWTNFAKTGSPSSELFEWQTYSKNNLVAQIDSKVELKPYNNISKIKLLNESKIT
ncbi:carboxylesterase family protein [Gammaproteobacteria bacterium]|nr:carboxylesterase family protein [Gammaproteobacteria bacterium]